LAEGVKMKKAMAEGIVFPMRSRGRVPGNAFNLYAQSQLFLEF
jgi:hypothetical protein